MRSRLSLLTAALILAAVTLPLHAQGFTPAKPVEFVAHTGPGTGADTLVRFIASAMEKEKILPVRMQVVNKPGGGGLTAIAYLAEKRGDPYTLGTYASVWIVNSLMREEAKFTMKDLTPVAQLLSEPALLVVKSDAPYRTLKDFIDAAKVSPGQLKQSGASVGGRDWMVRQLLTKHTGANWAFISFPAMGERMGAVLGGHANIMVLEPQEAGEHIRSGSLRPIAQVHDKRLPTFPNVPTIRESGFEVPNVPQLRGVVTTPGISGEALAYWQDAFARLAKSPTWKKYLAENQLGDVFLTGAELGGFIDDYSNTIRRILLEGGMKVVR